MKKKKVEMLFKGYFQVANLSQEIIKPFLEEAVAGLKVKTVEFYPGRTVSKAVITSNLVALLTGQDTSDESGPAMRSRSIYGGHTGLMREDGSLAEKEKEIGELGAQLSKVRKELMDEKSQNEVLQITLDALNQQVVDMTSKIEDYDAEKYTLEQKNKKLADENIQLEKRLENWKQANISGAGSTTSEDFIALQELMEQKEKNYEEDMKVLHDQISAMSLKMLAEQESIEGIKRKAQMAEVLEQSVAPLEAENKKLKETLEEMKEDIETKDKIIKENIESIDKLKKESKEHLKRMGKLETLIRKSETKATEANEKLKKYEQAKEVTTKEQDTWKQKISELEEKNNKLSAELQQRANELAALGQSKEEGSRVLIENLKTEENLVKKLEAELKAAQNLAEDLKKKLKNAEGEAKTASNKVNKNDKEELNKIKEELDQERKLHEKTKEELKKKQANETHVNSSTNLSEELTSAKKKIADLETRLVEVETQNKSLQKLSDECAGNMDFIETMQRQHEEMVKANAELKVALFEAEVNNKASNIGEEKVVEYKQIKIIEEIQQILAEVIYSYKTMSTNAKQFAEDFIRKKDQVEALLIAIDDVEKAKKSNEQFEIIKNLEEDAPFLKGFPPKPDQLKTMLSCLRKVAIKKSAKLEEYESEIKKYNNMVVIADNKVTEYEQKLAFYC